MGNHLEQRFSAEGKPPLRIKRVGRPAHISWTGSCGDGIRPRTITSPPCTWSEVCMVAHASLNECLAQEGTGTVHRKSGTRAENAVSGASRPARSLETLPRYTGVYQRGWLNHWPASHLANKLDNDIHDIRTAAARAATTRAFSLSESSRRQADSGKLKLPGRRRTSPSPAGCRATSAACGCFS